MTTATDRATYMHDLTARQLHGLFMLCTFHLFLYQAKHIAIIKKKHERNIVGHVISLSARGRQII